VIYSVVRLETVICSVLGLCSLGGEASGLIVRDSTLILFIGVSVSLGGDSTLTGGKFFSFGIGVATFMTSVEVLKKERLVNISQ